MGELPWIYLWLDPTPGQAQCSQCVFSSQSVRSATKTTVDTSPFLRIAARMENPKSSVEYSPFGINPWAVRDNEVTETSPSINRARG